MNPNIMSGRLVVTDTRVPVTVLWEQKRAGQKIEDIAKDFELNLEVVQQALAHIGLRQKAA